ncbi:hypothetical protein ACFRMO_08125 [Streptomyces anulatus]|uniref:hypothetical protein n=1 Tax=Streptomyces anulatus TaxID=1892 RepID=UPI0036C75209
MSTEQPTPVRLTVLFPGAKPFTHDTEVPADWVRRCGHADVDDYVSDELVPEALIAAGLYCQVNFPDGRPSA